MPIKKIALFFVLFATSATTVADLLPHKLQYRIEFYLGFFPLSGKIDQLLINNNDGSWRLDRSGLIYGFKSKETSYFYLRENDVIEPLWYLLNQTGITKDKQKRVKFAKGNRTRFDPLSLTLRIALDLQQNPQKKHFSYLFSDDQGKEEMYTYVLQGTEVIETALGEIDTLVILSPEQKAKGQYFVFWLAPKYGYIIAKSQTFQGDKKQVEITLKSGRIGKRSLK